jgi:hypothetical protein
MLQALHVYTFSTLVAPNFVLMAIKTLQRNFLWQGLKTGKKIALISWDKGGLGLRDPSAINKILSARYGGGGSKDLEICGPRSEGGSMHPTRQR